MYLGNYTKQPELKFFVNKAPGIPPANSLASQRNVTLRIPVPKINTSNMASYINKETLKISAPRTYDNLWNQIIPKYFQRITSDVKLNQFILFDTQPSKSESGERRGENIGTGKVGGNGREKEMRLIDSDDMSRDLFLLSCLEQSMYGFTPLNTATMKDFINDDNSDVNSDMVDDIIDN